VPRRRGIVQRVVLEHPVPDDGNWNRTSVR
jgi:hypothetical protein